MLSDMPPDVPTEKRDLQWYTERFIFYAGYWKTACEEQEAEVAALEARVAGLRAVTDDLQTVFDEHVDDEINVSWIRKKLESLDA